MKAKSSIKKSLILPFIIAFIPAIKAQHINVLFLGNSYTSVNDLPGTINGLLEGSDKTMYYASNTPGGCCFFQHATSSASLDLIRRGEWDYVVLQEQSQMPSIDYYRYGCMYPAAAQLHDSIMKYNPCAEIVFYMTWGRRDGGQQCEDYGEGLYCSAEFRDFDHMQDTMTRAYCEVAELVQSRVAPVGEAWRYARQHSDINLFSSDGSHPSMQGTYLTACTFYTTFFGESPLGLPYPASISEPDANLLQKAAFNVMLAGHTHWNFSPILQAAFNYQTDDQQHFQFTNTTEYPRPLSFRWDFGDGTFSDEESSIHEYTESGLYTVKFIVESCQKTDSIQKTVEAIVPDGIVEDALSFTIYPNPAKEQITLSGNGWLSISNMMGQKVISQHIDGQVFISLERGIYIATFTDGQKNCTTKIIMQ